MSDKEVIHVIVTAPFATNRGYLAKRLAKHVEEYGITTDVSNIPMIDIDPPCNVEKGTVLDPYANWLFSEHHVGRPFAMTKGEVAQPLMMRPTPPETLPRHVHAIAVCGVANSGKSTLVALMANHLKTTERDITNHHSFNMLGDEPVPSLEMAEANAIRIKERGIVVVFHVRAAKLNSSIFDVLATCDKVAE